MASPLLPPVDRTLSWLDAVFNQARDAVFVSDENGQVVDVNRAACTLTGYSRAELLQLRIPQLLRDGDTAALCAIHQRILAGEETVTEAQVLRRDGTSVDVEFNNRRLVVDGVRYRHTSARDLTDRRQAERGRLALEARIQQVQKLESLGVLAGGIAHDFNNLLVSILGNAGLALMDLPADSPARANLREIEVAALRASELTKQMLAYSGKGHFLVQPLDLSQVVGQMDALLRSSVPPDTGLTLDLAAGLPPVLADLAQLGQVLMNLVTNASDALSKGRGQVSIATFTGPMDRAALSATYLDDNLPAGPYVMLQVRDSGCGMDAATRTRVFDPFFSTKFPGRGLGMAAVLGIVRGHRGAIRVESETGLGTTVTVFFPALAETAARAEASEGLQHTRGLVLVVDDTEAVATVAERVLRRAGYDVQVARSGERALELFAERAGDISVVLLDLSMPGMDGLEVLERLRAARPDLPVLLSSGFQAPNPQALEGRRVSYLQKPYQAALLVERIEQAVAATTPRLPLDG